MRTSTRQALTINHNVSFMTEKYEITHMIAAFGYEEVGVSDGRYRSHVEEGSTYIPGHVFPWHLCRDLGTDLASMAGWSGNDNKVTFMVVMKGEVALLNFHDFKCTLVSWSAYWREEIPSNVYKGREKAQKAYSEWRSGYMREQQLQAQAKKARTFSHEGRDVWEKCTKCAAETNRKEVGTPICYECATQCANCDSSTDGAKLCAYCQAEEERRAEELVCDKCGCIFAAPHSYEVGDPCDIRECVGRLAWRYTRPAPHESNSGTGLSYPGVWSQVEEDCKSLKH